MRSYIIAGNWKMNLGPNAARQLTDQLLQQDSITSSAGTSTTVVVCPPYVSLTAVHEGASGSPILLGAQDCHQASSGAFTGDVSAEMLTELGCTWVIVGHSERRRDHGETNALIAAKATSALNAGLRPIICVGESLEERQQERTRQIVTAQVGEIADLLGQELITLCVIAYEPIWAIGTGLAASPEQAQEVHAWIRETLLHWTEAFVPILYGGSVTDANAAELFACKDIDGALVGGASLKAGAFGGIVSAAIGAGSL